MFTSFIDVYVKMMIWLLQLYYDGLLNSYIFLWFVNLFSISYLKTIIWFTTLKNIDVYREISMTIIIRR